MSTAMYETPTVDDIDPMAEFQDNEEEEGEGEESEADAEETDTMDQLEKLCENDDTTTQLTNDLEEEKWDQSENTEQGIEEIPDKYVQPTMLYDKNDNELINWNENIETEDEDPSTVVSAEDKKSDVGCDEEEQEEESLQRALNESPVPEEQEEDPQASENESTLPDNDIVEENSVDGHEVDSEQIEDVNVEMKIELFKRPESQEIIEENHDQLEKQEHKEPIEDLIDTEKEDEDNGQESKFQESNAESADVCSEVEMDNAPEANGKIGVPEEDNFNQNDIDTAPFDQDKEVGYTNEAEELRKTSISHVAAGADGANSETTINASEDEFFQKQKYKEVPVEFDKEEEFIKKEIPMLGDHMEDVAERVEETLKEESRADSEKQEPISVVQVDNSTERINTELENHIAEEITESAEAAAEEEKEDMEEQQVELEIPIQTDAVSEVTEEAPKMNYSEIKVEAEGYAEVEEESTLPEAETTFTVTKAGKEVAESKAEEIVTENLPIESEQKELVHEEEQKMVEEAVQSRMALEVKTDLVTEKTADIAKRNDDIAYEDLPTEASPKMETNVEREVDRTEEKAFEKKSPAVLESATAVRTTEMVEPRASADYRHYYSSPMYERKSQIAASSSSMASSYYSDTSYYNSYTRPSSTHYTSKFDSQVATGPFAQINYSNLRRSVSRERLSSRLPRSSSASRFSSYHDYDDSYTPRQTTPRYLVRSTSFSRFMDYYGRVNDYIKRTYSRENVYTPRTYHQTYSYSNIAQTPSYSSYTTDYKYDTLPKRNIYRTYSRENIIPSYSRPSYYSSLTKPLFSRVSNYYSKLTSSYSSSGFFNPFSKIKKLYRPWKFDNSLI